MTQPFSSLSLTTAMLDNLEHLGYQTMTPIQEQALPHVLSGSDVTAQAKTGSGKTVAFGIGLLMALKVKQFRIQSLVLCPTRELADQVAKELRRLARFQHNIKILTLCGGVSIGPQIGSLEHGAHIIVGTPGRIQDHLRKGTLQLGAVKTLVLDEADRMLDMGFQDAIAEIIELTPSQRQTLLFSATYPDDIQKLSANVQNKAINISVESVHTDGAIEQIFYEVKKQERASSLIAILSHYKPESAIIFCNTKIQTQDVADALKQQGFSALAINGDLEQRDRDQVLLRFSNSSCSILVATDVAARGLDIKDLPAVINYEISRDAEIYVHRIGRTGRAGKKGIAISLYTPDEAYKLNAIEDYQGQPCISDVPKSLNVDTEFVMQPPMVTLQIDGGRKQKVRPGDILGALTGDAGIDGKAVGKIDIFEFHAYVAIEKSVASQAEKQLADGKIKGRNFKVRKLR